jgi:hypothetical protein
VQEKVGVLIVDKANKEIDCLMQHALVRWQTGVFSIVST